MNTYKAFYKGKQMDVEAQTSYAAQQKAAGLFKAKKSYDVTVGTGSQKRRASYPCSNKLIKP